MATCREDVTFKTLDGLLIHGWLYPAVKRGPGVIMTPGVSYNQHSFGNIHDVEAANINNSSIASNKISTQAYLRLSSVPELQSCFMIRATLAIVRAFLVTKSTLSDRAKIIPMPSHL
jgi:hypothetical protein